MSYSKILLVVFPAIYIFVSSDLKATLAGTVSCVATLVEALLKTAVLTLQAEERSYAKTLLLETPAIYIFVPSDLKATPCGLVSCVVTLVEALLKTAVGTLQAEERSYSKILLVVAPAIYIFVPSDLKATPSGRESCVVTLVEALLKTAVGTLKAEERSYSWTMGPKSPAIYIFVPSDLKATPRTLDCSAVMLVEALLKVAGSELVAIAERTPSKIFSSCRIFIFGASEAICHRRASSNLGAVVRPKISLRLSAKDVSVNASGPSR